MRRAVPPLVLAGVLVVSLFSGCLGGDVVDLPTGAVPSVSVEDIARDAALGHAGADEVSLLAAFALVPRAAGSVDGLPLGAGPLEQALSAMAARVEPGAAAGRSSLWGFLFEAPGASEPVLVTVDTADASAAPQTAAETVNATAAALLGASGPIDGVQVDSARAVAVAQEVGEWARVAGNASSFVFMALTGANGTAAWRLVAGSLPGPTGYLVRVDAAGGTAQGGAQAWPGGAPQDAQTYNSGLYDLMLPDDERSFQIDVPARAWARMLVHHEMTGNVIGSPAVGESPRGTLSAPSGATVEVPIDEVVTVQAPEPGTWTLSISYSWPTSVRTVRVNHCIVPGAELLAPEPVCVMTQDQPAA